MLKSFLWCSLILTALACNPAASGEAELAWSVDAAAVDSLRQQLANSLADSGFTAVVAARSRRSLAELSSGLSTTLKAVTTANGEAFLKSTVADATTFHSSFASMAEFLRATHVATGHVTTSDLRSLVISGQYLLAKLAGKPHAAPTTPSTEGLARMIYVADLLQALKEHKSNGLNLTVETLADSDGIAATARSGGFMAQSIYLYNTKTLTASCTGPNGTAPVVVSGQIGGSEQGCQAGPLTAIINGKGRGAATVKVDDGKRTASGTADGFLSSAPDQAGQISPSEQPKAP